MRSIRSLSVLTLSSLLLTMGCATTTLNDTEVLSLRSSEREKLAAIIAKGDVGDFEDFFSDHAKPFKVDSKTYFGFISKNVLIVKGQTCGIFCFKMGDYLLSTNEKGDFAGISLSSYSQYAESAEKIVGELQFGSGTASNKSSCSDTKDATPECACGTGDKKLNFACQELQRPFVDESEQRWLCKSPAQKGEAYCTIELENGQYAIKPSSKEAFKKVLPSSLPEAAREKISKAVFDDIKRANENLVKAKRAAEQKAQIEKTLLAAKQKNDEAAARARSKGATHTLITIRSPKRCAEQLDGRYICKVATLCPLNVSEPIIGQDASLRSKTCKHDGPLVDLFFLKANITDHSTGLFFVKRGKDGEVQNAFGRSQTVPTWEVIESVEVDF